MIGKYIMIVKAIYANLGKQLYFIICLYLDLHIL